MPDLRQKISCKLNATRYVIARSREEFWRLQILLEVTIRKLVAVFKFSIVLCILLDCIICQVNVFVLKIVKGKFLATCPNVAIFEKVPSQITIMCHHHPVDANVKLSLLYQQWVLNVGLNYESADICLLLVILHRSTRILITIMFNKLGGLSFVS